MSWLFSRALVEASSAGSCSAGAPSAPSSATPTPQAFLWRVKTTAHWRRFPSGMTCAPLTADHGAAVLTWCLEAFRVRTPALQERALALTRESSPGCGERWPASLARYDRDSSSWRTAQRSLLEASDACSVTWQRWGMMRDGASYPLPTRARGISARGSGSLLPTLTVCGNNNRKGASPTSGDGLATALHQWPTLMASDATGGPGHTGQGGSNLRTAVAKLLPTLTVNDSKNSNPPSQRERNTPPLNVVAGGPLNPTWLEWFMGWPVGWTGLEPLETDKWQQWRRSHGVP